MENTENKEEQMPRFLTIKQYLLFKVDRTIAILGVIGLGTWALYIKTPETIQIAGTAIGILGGYIGGRTGNSK